MHETLFSLPLNGILDFFKPIGFGGFSTAKGTEVKVSDSALKKAQNLFGEDIAPFTADNEPKAESTKAVVLGGFSTASGSAVNMSEDKLKSAMKVFGDDITGEVVRGGLNEVRDETRPKLVGKRLLFHDQGGFSDDDETFVCDTQVCLLSTVLR